MADSNFAGRFQQVKGFASASSHSSDPRAAPLTASTDAQRAASGPRTNPGLAELDLEGRLVWCDDTLCALIGSPREQVTGHPFWDLFALDDMPGMNASTWSARRDALAGHSNSGCILGRDGARVRVYVTITLVRTPADVPHHIVVIAQQAPSPDHTPASAPTTHAAEPPASQLAAILNTMADGVLVFDREGRILQSNAADVDLLLQALPPGAVPQTLHERGQLLQIRDDLGQLVPEEQWPTSRVLRGETLRGAGGSDMHYTRLDGHESLIDVSGAPIRDASGQITGGVVILRDVTQRRLLERQTHEALAALLAMAEILVSDSDPADPTQAAGTALSWVAQRLANLTQTVLGCQRVTIVPVGTEGQVEDTWGTAGLIPEEERRQWQDNWPVAGRRSMRDFLPPDIIARLQLAELIPADRAQPPFDRWPNPLAWRSMLMVPMHLGGQLVGILTLDYGPTPHKANPDELTLARGVAQLAVVVLERERLLREREVERAQAMALAEANRRMDEFLGIATHELKTPVTSSGLSIGLAALYARDLLARARTRDATVQLNQLEAIRSLTDRAEENAERLSRLVADLLDVSRIRAGRLDFRMGTCDLAAILRDAVAEQLQLAPARAIHLRLAPGLRVPLMADADRIRQVVTNYLNNALKYSPADRPVLVSLRVTAGAVRVSVRDEGPGVPAADRERIWERFQRVEGVEVLSGTGVGLGLGLHICKTIIERHAGAYGMRSAPGKGATFWFSLPLAPQRT